MRGALGIQLLAALLLGVPVTAFAWGNEGHEVIALVAQRHLSPATEAAINELLAGSDGGLEGTSIWADCIKRNRACATDDGVYDQKAHPETERWHYVDVVLDADGYDPEADCPAGKCVVAKITEYIATLSSPEASPSEKLLALKFLVHLIGDIHQPLHAAYLALPDGSTDAGGNRRFVKPPAGRKTNLHAYWDTSLVRDELESADDLIDYAVMIDQGLALDPGPVDPVAWANESHQLARKAYSYQGVGGPHGFDSKDAVKLDAEYVATSQAIVRQQLRIAGVRLAALLNAALNPARRSGPSKPSPGSASAPE